MSNTNEALKQYARDQNVFLWEVAAKFGISDGNFSRRLRTEFNSEQLEQAKQYVDEIVAERR